MSTSRVPKYSRQREKNRADRAFTRIDGRKIKLGVYGSPESKTKYAELVGGRSKESFVDNVNETPTVNDLLVGYLEHSQTYYRQADGNLSQEYDHICRVATLLRHAIGTERAKNIGPKRLKQMREDMVAKGWGRKYTNDQVARIVRLFRWAASDEMIPASVSDALKTVEGLRRGRSNAKESKVVRPVDLATVDATLLELPEVVADMVRVQLLCGCRPGEVCTMRPCDLDRTAEVWLYTPEHHKTENRGHSRTVAIGPRAQGVLLRYLARAADAYCFQPKDSESKRLAENEAARVTPKSCGNRRGTNCRGTFKAGEVYSVKSYARAVKRAAARAGVEHWSPHRLRHTKATDIRKAFGLDAAQAVLGHRGAKVTQIYAELDIAKAAEVAAKIG